jgi:uncharacterized protein (TIGR00255 family)
MISSMTGYGEAQRMDEGVHYSVEIRTVNNRYLKPAIKVPDSVIFAEPIIEKLLRKKLSRGSVAVTLRIRNQTETAAYDVNRSALGKYADTLAGVEMPGGVQPMIDLASLSMLPGVCQMPELDESERIRRAAVIGELTGQALDNVLHMRQREGQILRDDLVRLCNELEAQLAIVAARAPVVIEEYHERLALRVQALVDQGRIELDKEAVARETALYAERSDISEELVRLQGHLDHFSEICDAADPVGRKLDFLAQEMLREANTIGSKSNDITIARAVVELKTLIDRLKEQVQNVE